MADLQGDDLFLVNRNDESATVQQSELMAELREDDYMIVNREDVTYKITGGDLIDSVIDPLTLTPVVTPPNPEIGDLLTVDPNVAGGKSPYSYTYQWKYRTSIVDPIQDYAGETGVTYQTVSSDEGLFIACEVTVTDSRGATATELSAFTAAVIKPPSIVKPSIIAPADNAGEMVSAESDEIVEVNVVPLPDFGTFDPDSRHNTNPWNISADNTTLTVGSTSTKKWGGATFLEITNGTIYSEVIVDNGNGPTSNLMVGICDQAHIDATAADSNGSPIGGNAIYLRGFDGRKRIYTAPASADGTEVTSEYTDTLWGTTGDIIGFRLDVESNYIEFFINGVAQGPITLHADGPWHVCVTQGSTIQGLSFKIGGSQTETVTELTVAGDKDLTVFQPLDDVQQDSGYTPQTSAITGVGGGGSYASTWFTDGTAVEDSRFVDNTWDKAFDGLQTAPTDGTYGTDLPLTFTFDKPMVGEWVFDVYLGSGVDGSTVDLFRLDDYVVNGDDPGWVTFGTSQYGRLNWTGTVNKITLPNGAMYLNKVTFNNAFLVVGNPPAGTAPTALTLTDDTDLANFRVGDVVRQDSIVTTSQVLYSSSADYDLVGTLGTDAFYYSGLKDKDSYTWNTEWDDFWEVKEAGTLRLSLNATAGNSLQLQVTGDATSGNGSYTSASSSAQVTITLVFDGPGIAKISYVSDHTTAPGGVAYYFGYGGRFGDFNSVPITDVGLGLPKGVVGDISGTTMTLSSTSGDPWSANTGNYVIGPATTPATGTVASTDPAANTMTLSVSDETFPKRWIVNQGKFVKGEETPSQDAAPDVSGEVEVTPETDEIIGTGFAPAYSSGTKTGSPYQNNEAVFGWQSAFEGLISLVGTVGNSADPDYTLTLLEPVSTKTAGVIIHKDYVPDFSRSNQVLLNGQSISPGNSVSKPYTAEVADGVPSDYTVFTMPVPGGVELTTVSVSNLVRIAGIVTDGGRLEDNAFMILLDGDKDLDLIEPGAAIKQNNDAATGFVNSVGPGNRITLTSSTGTWSPGTGNWVVGPTKAVPGFLKLYSSDFLSDPEGTLAHTQSDWQITLKTDTSYSSPVSQSLNDSVDLTVWEPSNLEEGTAYRCRVRHKSNNVVSEWSDDSTFKTADDADVDREIVAAPGFFHRYYPQNNPVKFDSPEKFVNYTCGSKFVGIGETGKVYLGPAYNEASGTFVLSAALDGFVQSKGEKAIDVYTAYAIDPENPGSTLILCESGNAYFNNSVSPIATNVKRIIKLGGVSRVCILETNDGNYIGANTHSVPYYIGNEQVLANTVVTVNLVLPAGDSEISSVTGIYGSYDAQSILIQSSKGNLYLAGLDNAYVGSVNLPTGPISNNAAQYITTDGWSDLQGEVTAIGCFSDGYGTSAGAWIRTKSKELYISTMGLTACWDGLATLDGPVKVFDNALTGAMSSYNSVDWYVIDKQGYAWDATASRTLTKNTTAGAIFGPQGSGHASYNYSVAHTFVIADT